MCTWVFMSLCGSLVGGWIRGWLALGPSGTWSPLPSGHFSPSLGCGGWIVPGVSLHLLLGVRPRCRIFVLVFGLLRVQQLATHFICFYQKALRQVSFCFSSAISALSVHTKSFKEHILTSHSTTNKKSLQRLNCFIFLHANIRATSGVTGLRV